jgi:hypothetical protein
VSSLIGRRVPLGSIWIFGEFISELSKMNVIKNQRRFSSVSQPAMLISLVKARRYRCSPKFRTMAAGRH